MLFTLQCAYQVHTAKKQQKHTTVYLFRNDNSNLTFYDHKKHLK